MRHFTSVCQNKGNSEMCGIEVKRSWKQNVWQSEPTKNKDVPDKGVPEIFFNWTNVQLYNTTRWQQQVIRLMFCRGTTDETTRLAKTSPDR